MMRVLRDIRASKRRFRIFLNRERRFAASHGVPLRERLAALRYGFHAEHTRQYGLSPQEAARHHLNDWQYFMRTNLIDHPYADVLRNKLIFDRVIRATSPDLLPPLVGYLVRGGERMIDGRSGDVIPTWPALAERAAEAPDGVICKPEAGQRGYGLVKFQVRDGQWLIDGQPGSEAEARRRLVVEDGLLVQEVVRNHPEIAAVWPGALSTARVMVMHEPETGEPFVARAVQRFGASRSGLADNVSSGGLAALIDLETGRLGRAGSLTPAGTEWREDHPDSGARITGMVLPGWSETVARLLDLSRKLPFLPYVGWDVAITPGGMMIIEGNYAPNVRVAQLDQPLLIDERVRRFYRHHRVI